MCKKNAGLTNIITPPEENVNNQLVQDISDFVGNTRAEVERVEQDRQIGFGVVDVTDPDNEQQPLPGTSRQTATISSAIEVTGRQEARKLTDEALLNAEKYKAVLAEPPGENIGKIIGQGVSDDDFFNLLCHVDSALIRKIEAGDFVDLDKLLPKDKLGSFGQLGDENRLEWVHREGGTFLVPDASNQRLIVLGDGNRHLEYMLPFTVEQTNGGLGRYGSTYQ